MLFLLILVIVAILIFFFKRYLDKYDQNHDDIEENNFNDYKEDEKDYDQTDWYDEHIDPYTGSYNGYVDEGEDGYKDDENE